MIVARRRQRRVPVDAQPSAPRDDDLVVAPSGDRWSVGPFGSRAQVSFATLEAAVAHARAFAATRSVEVWVSRDGVAFTRDGEDPEPGAVGE